MATLEQIRNEIANKKVYSAWDSKALATLRSATSSSFRRIINGAGLSL